MVAGQASSKCEVGLFRKRLVNPQGREKLAHLLVIACIGFVQKVQTPLGRCRQGRVDMRTGSDLCFDFRQGGIETMPVWLAALHSVDTPVRACISSIVKRDCRWYRYIAVERQ